MVTMSISGGADKLRDYDEWSIVADDLDDIANNHLLVPLLLCFGESFREAVVVCAREKLFGPVKLSRLQQLLGPDHAESLAEFGSDDVLPTITARKRKVCGAGILAACQVSEQRRVFIIRMRPDHQCTRCGIEAF